jgi:hypothetical protein
VKFGFKLDHFFFFFFFSFLVGVGIEFMGCFLLGSKPQEQTRGMPNPLTARSSRHVLSQSENVVGLSNAGNSVLNCFFIFPF